MQGACLQMRIGVCGDLKVCVSHPKLDRFHIYALCYKKAGAGVAQIMEPNFTQTVLLEELLEMTGYIVWSDDFSPRVYADKILPLPVVLSAKRLFVLLMLLTVAKQLLADKWY